MSSTKTLTRASLAIITTCGLVLAGCGKSDDKPAEPADTTSVVSTTEAASTTETATTTETTTATTTETTSAADAKVTFTADNFHLHDGFVKAVPADSKMTAVFGMLENHTDSPAHLVAFSADVNATMFELHEVVDGQMREKEGGFMIPAHGTHMLKPGGDHLMIMGLEQAIDAGSKINVTLKFENGDEVVVKDVPARQIGAGEEDYMPGHGDKKMDHDHSKMDHGKDHGKDHDHSKMEEKK